MGRAVWKLIRRGNLARDRSDWTQAHASYAEALASRPDLAHIWIQLGHARKELDRFGEAASAYRTAQSLRPGQADPWVHLGHVAKLGDDMDEAAACYLEALRTDPTRPEGLAELASAVDQGGHIDPRSLKAVAATLGVELAREAPDALQSGRHGIFLDISDLLAFFGHSRTPSGIQRVQLELAAHAIDRPGHAVALVMFSAGLGGWIRIEDSDFLHLRGLSISGKAAEQAEWRRTFAELRLRLLLSRPVEFPPGAVIVNIGTSWGNRRYFDLLREARARAAVAYVPLIFDLIPVTHPHFFVPELVRNFERWIGQVYHHADHFLAISRFTAEQLARHAETLALPSPAARTTVMPLDADYRTIVRPDRSGNERPPAGRPAGDFVLMVATLEPRKNHAGAFVAWRLLLDRLGPRRTPRLVCVGGKGWLNAEMHAMLADDRRLRRHVVLLSGVNDDALADLYLNCLFTLYPSFVEGWGLPVTESLCFGKVPVISATSAMPEAGGELALYVDPHDPATIAEQCLVLLDPSERKRREIAIADHYRPRTWSDLTEDVLAAVARTHDTVLR